MKISLKYTADIRFKSVKNDSYSYMPKGVNIKPKSKSHLPSFRNLQERRSNK